MRFSEIVNEGIGPNLSYYMEEGCGIFAVALSQAIPGGSIGILSRKHGEAFDARFPYEITVGGRFYDAKGARGLDTMAADFDMLGNYDVKGPWPPAEFRLRFMGNSDTKPLFGGEANIKEALALIKAETRG